MADTDTLKVSEWEKWLSQFKEGSKEAWDKFRQNSKLGEDSLVSFGDVAKVVGEKTVNAIHAAAVSALEFAKTFPAVVAEAQGFADSISQQFQSVKKTIVESGIGVSEVAIFLEPLTHAINQTVTGMGELGKSGFAASSSIKDSFETISPVLKGIPMGAFISNMSDGAARASALEKEILAMATAQGRASSIFDSTNRTLVDTNKLYIEFADLSSKVAIATNQTVSESSNLLKQLSSIPGSLNEATMAVEVSKLAAAAGRDNADVAKQVADMYTRLGISGHDANAAMALIHEKAGDSKLRMEAFNQTVMTVAGSFKMLGDNTVATTNFVTAFDKAFADSKISPEAMKEVITSIGQGVAQMDVAKKAFVSSTTGGPGGLAGAIQMDYAIQTGHADEVIRKTMMAMQSQFGGQVVTLKDAAQNPALAGEFYKQIQYLTQVAGIAKDEDQAKRILEAMKSGVMDYLKPGAGELDKDTALSRQLDKGTRIQEIGNEGIAGILKNTTQMAEVARLEQSKMYLDVLSAEKAGKLGDLAPLATQVHSQIENALRGSGVLTGALRNDHSMDMSYKEAGIEEFAKVGEHGKGYATAPNWHSMLGAPLGIDFEPHPRTPEPLKPPPATVMTPKMAAAAPPQHDLGLPKISHPGTDIGAASEHRKIGITELPELKLPSAKEAGKERDLGIPELNFTHTFRPIQLDITGVGDQMVSRQIKLELDKSERERTHQAAGGVRE